ncbi:MAG: M42 family metallopeptidase [Anaerolineae bacterium]
MINLLQRLSDAISLSGDEGAVRDILRDEVAPHCDDIRVDALGNLICHKSAKGDVAPDAWPRKVMVTAHMDEVGLMITHINEDGSLRFGAVGGIDPRILVAKRVVIGEKAVPGVIGARPIHLTKAEDRKKVLGMDELTIDIGVKDKDAAAALVSPGDYAGFDTRFQILDETGLGTAMGKAFDDRVGCAVLAQLVQGGYPFDLYAVFTAQEEVGLRGATVAAQAIEPDVGFALEGTICDDLPKDEDVSPVTVLGDGPAITLMDHSFIADRRLVNHLVHTAEARSLPYQFKRAVAGGTDSGAMHLAGEGVPAVTVAVPARYIHGPVGMISLADYRATVALMRAALETLQGGIRR